MGCAVTKGCWGKRRSGRPASPCGKVATRRSASRPPHHSAPALAPYVPQGEPFGRAAGDQVIRFLFLALQRYGIVEQVRSARNGDDPGYQLNAAALRWLPANGGIRPIDRTRLLEAGEIPPEVNRYFVECYRSFVDLKCVLEAREHTAQVDSQDRSCAAKFTATP